MKKSNKYYIPLILVLAVTVIALSNYVEKNTEDLRSKAAEMTKETVDKTKCVRANPSLIISPKEQSGSPGKALTYNLTIKNNDNSLCSPSYFYVSYFQLESNWTQDPKYFEIPLSPGQTANKTIQIKSAPDAKPGAHQFIELAREGISDSDIGYQTKTTGIYNIKKPVLNFKTPANNSVISRSGNVLIETECSGFDSIKSTDIYLNDKLAYKCLKTPNCRVLKFASQFANGINTISATCIGTNNQTIKNNIKITKR